MEPLDPELRRLVHDGMVQAVPSQEVEDRVLHGLLARLPHGGPPGGQESGTPEGEESSTPAGEGAATAGPAVATAASKPWLWVVLGATAMAGAVAVGGALEPERPPAVAQQDARAPGASAKTKPVSAGVPEPSARSRESSIERTPPSSDPSITVVAPDRASSSTAEASGQASPSRRPASGRSTDTGSTPTPPAAAPTPDDLAAEIQQIAAADRALARGEARRALELARAHAEAYPQGQLGVERAAIEHAARCQLAEPGAVEAAAAFLRAHADAPAAAKVRTRCATAR
jgi:hypothetical protein